MKPTEKTNAKKSNEKQNEIGKHNSHLNFYCSQNNYFRT